MALREIEFSNTLCVGFVKKLTMPLIQIALGQPAAFPIGSSILSRNSFQLEN
jgi:hypothetical protein